VALNLEKLEDRITPTQITVLTNSDAVQHTGTSLRDAIAQANTDAARDVSDTIVFDSSLNGTTIALAQGQLELRGAGTGTITIDGGSQIAVSGNSSSRVFQIDSGVQAVLTGITIENGMVASGYGGGIYNAGTLTVSNTTISSNSSAYGGDGIYNANTTGILTVSGCTISGNSLAGSDGGGIYNDGFATASISNTTISGNFADLGGGIWNDGALTVNNVIFSGNSATIEGGGIENDSGNVTVTNTTFANNSVNPQYYGNSGGAIDNLDTLTITNSTFFGNSANIGGGLWNANVATVSNCTFSGNSAAGPRNSGGGINYSPASFTTLTLVNNILAGNTATTNPDLDGGGGFVGGSNNLIGDPAGLAGTGISDGDAQGDIVGHDPLLAAPGYYGGSTQTMALLPGSPAIAAGGADTTLTAAIGATDTTLSVANAATVVVQPSWLSVQFDYLIQIDGEQMEVTQVDLTNNTLTVIRGVNGTSAIAHSTGAGLYPTADQRGIGRPTTGSPDMGAFQSQGFSVSVISGDSPQSAQPNAAFTNPLGVSVTAIASGEPVDGGVITFTVLTGSDGQGATLSSGTATISGGQASVTATANGYAGSYQVSAGATGVSTPALFDLSNTAGGTVVVFTTISQTLTAGQASGVMTVELQDSSGNVVQAGSGGVTLTLGSTSTAATFLDVSGQPLSSPSITIPEGSSTTSFEYEDTLAGSPTVTATSPGLLATQVETVQPAAPSAVVFTTRAQTVTAGQPSTAITVELEDQYGNVAIAGSGGLSLALTTTASAGSFLDGNGQPLSGPNLTIAEGASNASFEYEDPRADSPTVTVAATDFSVSQQETIVPGAPTALVFTSSPQTVIVGQFSAVIEVRMVDSFGNYNDAIGGFTFSLSTTSTGGAFYNNNIPGLTPITSLTFGQGEIGELTFYYKDTQTGTPTLTVTGPGFSGSQVITITGADLTVSSVGVPSSGTFGQPIDVSWTVQNVGVGTANEAWTDGIYLSSSSTFDSSATLFARVPVGGNSPLDAGASYSQSGLITVPLNDQSVSGTYYVFVYTDDQNQQVETNDNNNVSAAQPIDLSPPPLPDLVVNNVSAPASGFNNQQILVSWTDQNNGTATANGPWLDNVYYSTSSDGSNPVLLGSFTNPSTLAPGSLVQLTEAVTLSPAVGNLWIVVQTDANQGVYEGPFDHNNFSVAPSPTDVVPAPLPDLVVSSITPPASGVVSGTIVPVTYTVTNEGDAPTNVGQWQDAIFVSQVPNLVLTGNDFNDGFAIMSQPLGVPVLTANPSYLDVGQSYSNTVNVPFPVSAAGTWYVYVVANRSFTHTPLDNFLDTGPVKEASSVNDLTVSTPFTVTLAPTPDLVLSNVQTPAQAFSGQPLSISWSVTNQGTGIAIGQPLRGGAAVAPLQPATPDQSAWTDEVFLSSSPTLDGTATPLGNFTHSGALEAGAGYTDSEQVTLPVGISGSFYLIVQTDINGQVFENGATANNVSATPSAITVNLTPPPDLQASILSVPSTALASHSLTFTYQVNNIGAGATALSEPNTIWQDSFYLSPTPSFDASTAILLGAQTQTITLDPGANYQNTVTETLPDGLSGTYYLIVSADGGKAVFELDQTSKLGVSPGTIQVASQPADLAVTTVNAPSAAQAGATVLANWTVANQGTGDSVASSWQDNVYADSGSSLDSSAVLLGSFSHYGLLNAGASYTQSQNVTLPQRLDEQGPTALLRTPVPVNKFPDFVAHLVQRLQVLCPRLGKVKIAQVLARAGLHLGVSSVGPFFWGKFLIHTAGRPLDPRHASSALW
jgi:hypothetical protein